MIRRLATSVCPLDSFGTAILVGLCRTRPGGTLFQFTTIVQPNPVGGGRHATVLTPDTEWEFEVVLTGDNTNTITARWALSFERGWSENESEMLERIHVRRLSGRA